MDVALTCGDASLTVSPGNGGRFAALRLGDLQVLGRGGAGVVDWGCYPMAPYAGRVRRGRLTWSGHAYQLPLLLPPHAIHGVTLDRPWDVVDRAGGGTTPALITLRCDFDARWPWPGHAEQHIRLDELGLVASLSVHAEREPMPAWIGYHPWFARRLARGGPAEIALEARGMLARDADGMATATVLAVPPSPWDDCFVDPTWPVAVTWPGALVLRVAGDHPYVVCYDERPEAVCVEPQTGPPDAVALGQATVVAPGSPLTMTMTWTWEHLGDDGAASGS